MFRCSSLAVVVLFVALAFAPAHGASLAKRYPELTARKGSLGPVTLLIESAVLVDVDGDVKRADLAKARKFADLAVASFRDELVARGYTVRSATTASMGTVYEPSRMFHPATPSGKSDTSRVVHAPFYLDSALAGRPDVAAAWSALCRRVVGYERKNKAAPDSAAEAVVLGDSLGAPVVALVVLNGWEVPGGKQLRQSLLSGLLTAGTVTVHKVSVCRFQFALFDGRSGEILWSKFDTSDANATEQLVSRFVTASTKELP